MTRLYNDVEYNRDLSLQKIPLQKLLKIGYPTNMGARDYVLYIINQLNRSSLFECSVINKLNVITLFFLA